MPISSIGCLPEELEKCAKFALDVLYFKQLCIKLIDQHVLGDNCGGFLTSSEAIRNSPPYRQHPKYLDISPV
jgi:hypothetical protein